MINRVIITGSGGMLGNTLLEKIKNEKHLKIIAVSSQIEKLSESYQDYDNISVVNSLDIINDKDSSICINCAFPRTQDGETLANTMITTEKLIKELKLKNCEYIINISSQSVYAQKGDDIQDEEDTVNPSNLYGMTKFAIEQIVRLVCTENDMNYVNIRLGSLASTEFDQRMINRFYNLICSGEDIYIDFGAPKVSYLHIEDAASALVKLIKCIRKGINVDDLYNLSNNDWISIKDLALNSIDKAEELNIGKSYSKTQVKINDMNSDYNNVIDSSKFYKEFKWKPQYLMVDLIHDIFLEKLKRQA